jgi:hypothetical protein
MISSGAPGFVNNGKGKAKGRKRVAGPGPDGAPIGRSGWSFVSHSQKTVSLFLRIV